MKPIHCPYCNARAELIDSKRIYGRSYGNAWMCWPCDAYVGCHKTGDGRSPLGRLANAELRQAKRNAHAAFDPVWQSGRMNRSKAYKWLADALGIHKRACHIGMFDVDMCGRVVAVCEARKS